MHASNVTFLLWSVLHSKPQTPLWSCLELAQWPGLGSCDPGTRVRTGYGTLVMELGQIKQFASAQRHFRMADQI